MSTTAETIDRIRQWVAISGRSRRSLALEAGLCTHALYRIDEPDWNPTRATLEAVESLIPPDFDPDPAAARSSPEHAA